MKSPDPDPVPLVVLQGRIAALPLDPQLAREALRIEMGNYSENYWCASWLSGLEYDLWRQIESIRNTGHLLGVRPEAYACMLLAEIAGGWWRWPDKAELDQSVDAPCFIAMPEWLAHYDQHAERRKKT
jgi:hypothetical protein